MKKKKRLLWQLFVSYLFIIFLALASVTWYTLRSLQDWHLGQKASDLEVQALLLERHILENLAHHRLCHFGVNGDLGNARLADIEKLLVPHVQNAAGVHVPPDLILGFDESCFVNDVVNGAFAGRFVSRESRGP